VGSYGLGLTSIALVVHTQIVAHVCVRQNENFLFYFF
jgi:hypothetical protein